MAVTENFKNQAYDAALSSFIQYMNKRKISLYILLDIKDVIAQNEDERRDQKNKPLDAILFSLMREPINWTRFKDIMLGRISQNIQGMGSFHAPTDEKYDYLVHCVNTLIQSVIERGFHIKNSNHRLPCFEQMGKEIFENAAKKVFGNEFKIQKPKQSHMPQNRAEEEFLMKKMNELLSNGCKPQEACHLAIRELEMFRNAMANHSAPHSHYYINNNNDDEVCYDDAYDMNDVDDEYVDNEDIGEYVHDNEEDEWWIQR